MARVGRIHKSSPFPPRSSLEPLVQLWHNCATLLFGIESAACPSLPNTHSHSHARLLCDQPIFNVGAAAAKPEQSTKQTEEKGVAEKVPITKGGIGMAAASTAPKSVTVHPTPEAPNAKVDTVQGGDSEEEDVVVGEDLKGGKEEEEVTKEETEVEKLIREEEEGVAGMAGKIEAFKKARYEAEPAAHDAHDRNGSGGDRSGNVPLGTDACNHSAAIQLSSGRGSIPPSSSASDTAAAAAEAAAKHNRLLAAANAEAEAAVAVAEKAAAVKAEAAERQAAEKAAAEVAQAAENARLRAAAKAATLESIKIQAHAATATQTPPPTATVPVRPKELRFTVNTNTGQLPTWAEMIAQNKHIPAELMEQNKHMFEKHILDACKFAFMFSVLLQGLN